jgi:hypothetical protein
MQLFTRQVLLNPAHVRAGTAQALEMNRYVNEKTNLQTSLFQVLAGAPLGTLTFAFRTESYAASTTESDKLLQSDEYMQKVESGAQFFVGNPEDQVGTILHETGTIVGPPAAASVVSATIEISQAAAAVAWAIELADFTSKLTGVPGTVVSSDFGQYGRVAWFAYGSSLGQLEESTIQTNNDPGFAERLGKSAGLFVSGSGSSLLSRKIA